MTLPLPNPALRACVVVPARDEEDLIGSCLEALARQELGLERVLIEHRIPIERLLSVRVTTSPRLVGRASRGLSYDLARIALSLREEKADR